MKIFKRHHSFVCSIILIPFFSFFLFPNFAKCQNMAGTSNGITGISQLAAGWSNTSLNGGTPDLSTAAFCIINICPWNVSVTSPAILILPTPPTGDSIFADVATGYAPTGYVEKIGTLITNLIPGNTYTVKFYLLAGISFVAATSSPNPTPLVYFPTSVDVTINGITSVILLDSTNQNKWELFTVSFVANAVSATFDIGNPKPQPLGYLSGGVVCISVGDNAISCSNSIFLGADQSLCTGDSLTLNAALPNATYLWQDSSTNTTYTVTVPGTYFVTVNQPNCWSSDSINILLKPSPVVNFGKDTSLCEGSKLYLDVTTPNGQYLWQDNSTQPSYVVDHEGIYSVVLTVNGCTDSDNIKVDFKSLPAVNLGQDAGICNNAPLDLDVTTPAASYLWQDGSVNSHYIVTQPGTYWVKLAVDGCENRDTINVNQIFCDCKLHIPNAIPPNGDGINDNWVISERNCFKLVNVFIYNRYGSLVYKKDDYQNEWKGTYKLKFLPDGTYYYVINAITKNDTIQIFKGNVTILR